MRNLFRPLCLTALLAVAPTVLIGCSGGSSSNNSSSNANTRASFTYSTLENAPFLQPLDLRGALNPQINQEGIPIFDKGNGVFSYVFKPQVDVEGGLRLSNAAVVNSPDESRFLIISRYTTTGQDGPVGTVYTYDSGNQLDINLTRRFNSDLSIYGAFYSIISGSATVIANDGNEVTLQLENVRLRAITIATPEPRDIQVSGTITYNRKNVKRLKLKVIEGAAKS